MYMWMFMDPPPLNTVTVQQNAKKTLIKNSKFYLAFENALCEEYITEKFFMFKWTSF